MGGEFGDISTIMNNRDKQYEDVAQEEQTTALDQYKLEAADRADEYRRRMTETFGGGNAPKDLRTMYETMIGAAAETGNPGEVERLQEELAKLDLQKRKDAIDAINIAEKSPYGVLRTVYGDSVPISEQDAASIYNRRNQASNDGQPSPRKEKSVEVYDIKNNIIKNVLESESEAGQLDGRLIRTDDPRLIQIMPLTGKPGNGTPSKGTEPTDSSFKIFRDSAPTTAPQGGRGDRARSGPSVGDQVDTIIRKNKVK
jgi:hypothetical protein